MTEQHKIVAVQSPEKAHFLSGLILEVADMIDIHPEDFIATLTVITQETARFIGIPAEEPSAEEGEATEPNPLAALDKDWGEEIHITGGRPDWMLDDDRFIWTDGDGDPCYMGWSWWLGGTYTTGQRFHWHDGALTIRLPVNHPYYLATSRGFKYWPGGEQPEDSKHAGLVVLYRGGAAYALGSKGFSQRWDHIGLGGDIIGYLTA